MATSLQITNCFAVGTLNGTTLGGLLPTTASGCGITSSYWDTTVSSILSSEGGTGKTTAEMKTQATFSGWDFSTIWNIDSSSNSGYPFLRGFTFWTPPNLKPRIDGVLKTYSDGWVRIDGVLRKIDSMWTNIGGVLKKL
ncbi:hypothetical protein [Desulfitobacterium metallireducens]|uniref:Uncharacterized protein n=1 Tax=Desulfitobacterium metallireducens DSM 15288 TaxID=871968 RepID=W0EH68_9FIRM|nr:hypothetical protein [Desulfitobacterium metallireducens]AHF08559.1 hypothetical protein DESME_08865 [Desulfitobacterium metallireducens DSM 15288]